MWIAVGLLGGTIALAALWPAAGRANIDVAADTAPSARTPSAADSGIESWLVTRGLMGRRMAGKQPQSNVLTPPPGAEVDEARQSVSSTGQMLMQIKSWNETVGDNTVHIELTTLPGKQYAVGFWVFPQHRQGCAMFGWTLYDQGRPLKSTFWRNDPALRLAGAADLPLDLYPDSIPAMAFLRALDTPRDGAQGTLHQQLSPFSYVGQEVYAAGTERVRVPAGDFSALKVTAQADVGTLMPNWPRFVLRVIKPFVPRNTLYFQSTPPYRLLRQQGTAFVGGPEVTTELIRFYTAAAQPIAAR
jgi:hypothetical protein